MSFFGRMASVTIGNPGTTGILVEDLRIVFTVNRTPSSTDGNTSDIQIYNLNQQRRNKIDDIDDIVILKAGYKDADGLEVLSVGNISDLTNNVKPPDVVTNINTIDGLNFLLDEKIAISFNEGSSVRQILEDMENDYSGLKSNLSQISFTDHSFNTGFSFVGNTKDCLDKLTKIVSVDWSIQNNEIRYVPEGQTDETIKIILNSDTGLLWSPERIKIKKGEKKENANANVTGWKVISLLQPKAIPGGQVELSSREVGNNKLFKILSVSHSGDTHEGDFQTTMELKSLG
jgi:hypothetical protein